MTNRRPVMLHLAVFFLIAASAAGFFLTSYFTTGEPKTLRDTGWVDVAVNDPGFNHYTYTITAGIDPTHKPETASYQLSVCSDAFVTAPSRLNGAFLLHGRARVDPSSASGSEGTESSPMVLSGAPSVSFPQVNDPHVAPPPAAAMSLPSDLEVFPFSTQVFHCPSIHIGPRLAGRLTRPIESTFSRGPFRGPHRLYAWPGLGIQQLHDVAFGGSFNVGGQREFGSFIDNLPTTYELDGGILGPGELTEEIRPSSAALPDLRFVSRQPIIPFVRFFDIDSLQRLQGIGSLLGIVFGIAAGIGGAWLFEILRRSSLPPTD